MTPVYDHQEAVKCFVEAGIFRPGRHFGQSTAIGFANAEEGLVAGFVYHNFDPDSGVIEISAYAARRDWLNRARLLEIFRYPFDQLNCRVVVARHSERNRRVNRIFSALGATQTTVPELRGPGVAEVISVLTREAWRNSKFYQE